MNYNHHQKKGQLVRVKWGPLEGKTVEVVDFVKAQHQGKEVARIKTMEHLLAPLKSRGLPIDDEVVFVKFYPSMEFGCVHDTELLSKNVTSIEQKKKPTRKLKNVKQQEPEDEPPSAS